MKKVFIFTGLLLLSFAFAAENLKDNPQAQPTTKTERMQQTKNGILVKGYLSIGAIDDKYGTNLEITIYEFNNLKTKNKEYSMAAAMKSSGKYSSDSASSYVDYEEISDLIKGFDYISTISTNPSSLKSFETKYATKGGLSITAFNNQAEEISYAITCGEYHTVTMYFDKDDFIKFGRLIGQALTELDKIKDKK